MKNQFDPQPGDILVFFRPHRLLDYAIKIFTRSKYYHVGLYAGNQQVIEARPKGVSLDPIGARRGGFSVVPAPEGRGAQALEWALSRQGAGFDHTDFVVIFLDQVFWHLHINHNPANKFSCTEFVADAYKAAGVDLFPGKDASDIEPKEFASLAGGSVSE